MDHYKKIRIIRGCTDNLAIEDIVFTEDFESPPEDFLPVSVPLASDDIVEGIDLPEYFPLESRLRKQ